MKAKFINKEISWLSFNARVLQEAADPTVPLIERIKFLGIFSNNLDEFFRVRVATLKRLAPLKENAKSIIGHDPNRIINRIEDIVIDQTDLFNDIYDQIILELARNKIIILADAKGLDEEQAEFVHTYFLREVRPKLFPIMFNKRSKFPHLKDHAIYLTVLMRESFSKQTQRLALIEVPTTLLPRFLILPKNNGNQYIMLLDDVIRFGLRDIFSIFDYQQFEAYTIKTTRDAELDFDNDPTQSYMHKIHRGLQKRKSGRTVRFIYDEDMPDSLLKIIVSRNKVNKAKDTIIPGARYHNFKDFIGFPRIGPPSFIEKTVPPLPHKDLTRGASALRVMRKKDVLLHFPYQSFMYIIDLLRDVSIDPKVKSISITLYRVAKNSSIINALINAAKNGKNVTVVLELQARFDEEANLQWANKLQEEGVKVIFGVQGLKVHSKLCLIKRKENKKIVRYCIIGTGNFNEDTAKIYTDHCLLTTHEEITSEAEKIFDFFENNYRISRFRHLVVAPFQMRKTFSKLIQKEIKNAEAGIDAAITVKLNNFSDYKIIKKLYRASQAGVKIRMIVRGMFSIAPKVRDLSENIEAISIVDKYLEHSRLFIFHNGGDEKFFLSSSDWMTRNLDRRVEVTCPIYDKSIQEEIRSILELQWQDNVKARILDRRFQNQYRRGMNGHKAVRSQEATYEYLKSIVGEEKEAETPAEELAAF